MIIKIVPQNINNFNIFREIYSYLNSDPFNPLIKNFKNSIFFFFNESDFYNYSNSFYLLLDLSHHIDGFPLFALTIFEYDKKKYFSYMELTKSSIFKNSRIFYKAASKVNLYLYPLYQHVDKFYNEAQKANMIKARKFKRTLSMNLSAIFHRRKKFQLALSTLINFPSETLYFPFKTFNIDSIKDAFIEDEITNIYD